MNKKQILEKIKKCLALSKSANEHESANNHSNNCIADAILYKFNCKRMWIHKSPLRSIIQLSGVCAMARG